MLSTYMWYTPKYTKRQSFAEKSTQELVEEISSGIVEYYWVLSMLLP